LAVKSTPGQGSVFALSLTFPVISQPAASPGNPAPGRLPEQLRVLVCEDNTVNQTIISAMLTRLGVSRFRLCATGAEALDVLTAEHDDWDLVLMDCEMPVMDGLTAVRELRLWEQQHRRPRKPVVALTAHVMPQYRERCREAGMDSYMAKPIVLADLERHLQHPVDP
ncbi:MAG TPA: response regulator, partial [Fluviicoccus sp.]|nr:response regulator [Fluviicoccus sp.]